MLALKELQTLMIRDLVAKNEKTAYLDFPQRITAYGNGYYNRLLDILESRFPVLAWFVGKDVFDNLCLQYIQNYPPVEYNINHYGTNFQDFLHNQKENQVWIDLALAQNMLHRSTQAAQKQKLSMDELTNIPLENWAYAQFTFQPYVYLFTINHPVHLAHQAYSKKENPPLLKTNLSHYVTFRKNQKTYFEKINSQVFTILSALQAGNALANALEKIDEEVELFKYFQKWQDQQFFTEVKFS